MGWLDKWLGRFLDDPKARVEPSHGPIDAARPEAVSDPFDFEIEQARAQLTVDGRGRRYAEGNELLAVVASLDAGGRGRAADALLADALLVSAATSLRRRLAERLLHRGDTAKARVLLDELCDDDEHATWALTQLGELLEQDGDEDAALEAYESVLAIDIRLTQPKVRARRLRARRDEREVKDRQQTSELARFLGARAAGSRYAVLEEIGRGGAATVFRARDRVLGREVALKIFHPRGRAEERRARLVEEARIAGRFDHPHIVPILDVDEERDLLVMLLCDGGTLRQRLARGRLAISEAAEVGSILLRTLADVHDAGSLHLDVKPSNLLIHEGRLYLCDFGTAGLVHLGAAAGTRAYMAPEQRSRGEASARADTFAAGLLIYETLTGHLPAGVEAGRPLIELTELPAGPARRALEDVLEQLCSKDPADRPSDERAAADRLLEAAALPISDKDGAALCSHLESLAAREGEASVARLLAHPLVRALRPPPTG